MARKPKSEAPAPAAAAQTEEPKKRVSAPWFAAKLDEADEGRVIMHIVSEWPDLRSAEGEVQQLAEKEPGQTFIPVKFGDRVQKREVRRIETVAQPLFEGGFKPLPAAGDLTEGLE